MKMFYLLIVLFVTTPLVAQITLSRDTYQAKDTSYVTVKETNVDDVTWFQNEVVTYQGGRKIVQTSEPMRREEYLQSLRADLERMDSELQAINAYTRQLQATRQRYLAALEALDSPKPAAGR